MPDATSMALPCPLTTWLRFHIEQNFIGDDLQPRLGTVHFADGTPFSLKFGFGAVQVLGFRIKPLVDLVGRNELLFNRSRFVAKVKNHLVGNGFIVFVRRMYGPKVSSELALSRFMSGVPVNPITVARADDFLHGSVHFPDCVR